MANYANYAVPELYTINDWVNYALSNFCERYAFFRNDEYITFEKFFSDVAKCEKALRPFVAKKVGIRIKDTYLFTVAYFSVVLSGNIAILQSADEELAVYTSIVPIDELYDDSTIEQFINDTNKSELLIKDYEANKCCTILFSSGTTSSPKGIMLSSSNIAHDIVAGMQKYQYADGRRYINVIPFTHAFGLVCDILAPLFSGSVICCLKSKFELFSVMPVFKPTNLNLPPVMVKMLLDLIENNRSNASTVTGGNLEKILSGGAGTEADIVSRMRDYGINVYGCYGLTECSPCVAVNRDSYYKDGSAGVILDCNNVRIDDMGEIHIKGSNVMLGYYPQEEVVPYEHSTGDIGYIDEDGFLFVTGRVDDLIVLKTGLKLMPQSIEQKIVAVVGVKEVIVFSPKKYNGEKLICLIVINDIKDKESIIRELSSLSLPTPMEYVFQLENLLRNKQGKIMRKAYE